MEQAIRTVQGAGASGQLQAEFRALLDATLPDGDPRYALRPVLNWLARFIVGREGGPNRDASLYELCHLVNAVEACGSEPNRLAHFFLSSRRATPLVFAQLFDDCLATDGWRREGFSREKDGVDIHYRDGNFKITFGRMPFLVALYEFLCGMDDYGFYQKFNETLEAMVLHADSIKSIQKASNAIARHVRQYRNRHLNFSGQNERFELIYNFLREQSPKDRILIDDASVLEFWLRHSDGDDFRGYKTVFNAFASFIKALDDTARARAAEGASPIGIDRAAGEIDPGDANQDLTELGDWHTPFAILDVAPAAQIKFFKKRGEREPIESLMEYGPRALALPLAFLRLESFGGTQSAITTDLQVKRGADSIRRRITCADCEPYAEKQLAYSNVLSHVRQLQKATLHALYSEEDSDVVVLRPDEPTSAFDAALDSNHLPEIDAENNERIAAEAAHAFRRLTRKGFDDAAIETMQEGFRTGAGAILAIAAQLEAFLDVMARLDEAEPGLDTQHAEDRAVFTTQFARIYGDAV